MKFASQEEMTVSRWMTMFGLVVGPALLLSPFSTPVSAQSLTIDAFVHLDGKEIPAICLIARVPPKDLCGDILQGVTAAQLESARKEYELKIEQQSRPLIRQNK
jgi:hypothetical protein